MNSKILTFLLLAFVFFFNNSCSNGDEVQTTPTNTSLQNPAQNSNKILKFIKSFNYSNPTHYFQSSNGKVNLWNTSYNASYNAVIHSVTYNSMGKIDKISISNSSSINYYEAQFKYENNLLSEIVYLHKDTSGNFLLNTSYTVQYKNSKIYRLIRTTYNTPQDYINDTLNNCNITELEFSNENVTKASFITGQYSRATGVINAESYAYFKRLYTYNNSIINPYSTFPIEFQVYLAQASLENSEYNADYFSKNAKNSITTHVNESLFSSYSFNYETDASLNGLPNKIDSNNGNFGSKATFEYDFY
ncbi:hypothetical protein OF897_03190 [Chryseobacterium formosus]|uniref:DUF4595 domain-containing protein n=1 Tax=Chryseobacterium formosus TaxID=1537363 RepID=A0ABT3XP62_9FLAO|nr:hypothetical protein [Chryseobacterium formosus]MCX8522926.1 hypothetical protein [Chryseobacterium formosus]